MKYDANKDYKPYNDMFEPCSIPRKDYLRLPENIKIEFIDSEDKINSLRSLIGQKYIGVDAEWRPQVHRWHKTEGLALFQIGSEKEVYLIDIIGLKNLPLLDEVLSAIFSH